jgi:hypothetical protein
MEIIDFSILFRSGGYSLPVLVELRSPGKPSWYFTNDIKDIQWGNKLFLSVPMNYKHPRSRDGVPLGGTLEIDIDQQQNVNGLGYELLKWFDEADDKAEIEVIAAINNGEIKKIGQLTQRHGTVNWDGEKITWNMGEEDRLQMQVNPINFDADALSG